jgi:Carboxypeptidase regulatory-like domain
VPRSRCCTRADDGTFVFEHVAAGDFLLKIEHKHKPPFLHGPLTVPAAGTMDRVVVELPDACRIEGVLKDPRGQGLPNVMVTLTADHAGRNPLWLGRKNCRTDAAGNFRFDGLVNTDYVLNASSEGPDGVTVVFRSEVKVQDDGPTQVVLASPGGCSITGTIRFLGQTGTGLRIQLYRRADPTGGKGGWQSFGAGLKGDRFTVRGLPEGIYSFSTVYWLDGKRQSHFGPKNVVVRPGADNQVLIQIPPR